MKVLLTIMTITALLVPTLLEAQVTESRSGTTSYEESSHRKKGRPNLEFDRIDYFYKNNLLQYAVQHNGGGGFPRTWRYFNQQEGADALINQLKTKYPHKQLHGATQVVFRNKVTYEIIMEDKKSWYVYQSDTLGAVSLKKRFRKR
jgi:hypothetical protein